MGRREGGWWLCWLYTLSNNKDTSFNFNFLVDVVEFVFFVVFVVVLFVFVVFLFVFVVVLFVMFVVVDISI